MAHSKKKKVEAKQQELKAKKAKASAPVSPMTAESRHSQPRVVKEKQQEPKQMEPKAKKAKAVNRPLPATTGKPRRGQHRVVLEENMTIYMAAAQKVMLLEALVNCQELDLDLSQVSEMDTAGFQLLALAKRESQKTGHALRIVGHSLAVREVLEFLNMVAFFGDPLVIPANEHS